MQPHYNVSRRRCVVLLVFFFLLFGIGDKGYAVDKDWINVWWWNESSWGL